MAEFSLVVKHHYFKTCATWCSVTRFFMSWVANDGWDNSVNTWYWYNDSWILFDMVILFHNEKFSTFATRPMIVMKMVLLSTTYSPRPPFPRLFVLIFTPPRWLLSESFLIISIDGYAHILIKISFVIWSLFTRKKMKQFFSACIAQKCLLVSTEHWILGIQNIHCHTAVIHFIR